MASEQRGYYDINGTQYPRVTRILEVIGKPGLDRWRGRLGNTEADRVAREGADFGTSFHEIAADINRGSHQRRGWRPPDFLRLQTDAYILWMNKYIEEIVYAEKLVVSEERIYAGTADLVAKFRGDEFPSVIDIKTSNSVGSDWPLQLSAYKKALNEEGISIQRRVIVRIPKKGKIVPEMYDYKEHDIDEAMWLRTLDSWNWLKDNDLRQKVALVNML